MEDLYTYLKRASKEREITEFVKNTITTNSEFSCVIEYQYPNSRRSADIMLLYNDTPYACVEIKKDIESKIMLDNAKKQLEEGREVLDLRFGILTDGVKVILYDWWLEDERQTTQAKSLQQVCAFLSDQKEETLEQVNKKKLSKAKEILCDTFKQFIPEAKIKLSDIESGEGTTLKLKKTAYGKLFDKLVPPYKEDHLCRFTTITSIFATLQKHTFRMCATEGMNDIDDGKYLWEQLYKNKDKASYLPKDRDTILIMSCSPCEKISDLTMWRLYADDTKGVCLEFGTSELGDKYGFYLRRVQYENPKDPQNLMSRLANLIKTFSTASLGFTFIFNYWELWGAFVKSKEYIYEDEIRLAYIPSVTTKKKHKKEWMIANSSQIVSEYIDFDITSKPSFPLQLKKIWLGTSCPEKNVNKLQLKKMIEASEGFKGKNIEVEISDVDNYRPSK